MVLTQLLLSVRMHSMLREATIDANIYLVCVLPLADEGGVRGVAERRILDSSPLQQQDMQRAHQWGGHKEEVQACCFLIFRSFRFYTKQCDWMFVHTTTKPSCTMQIQRTTLSWKEEAGLVSRRICIVEWKPLVLSATEWIHEYGHISSVWISIGCKQFWSVWISSALLVPE